MPKESQNGIKIDASTHQSSMPKYNSKEIMKVIKNLASLKGEIIQIHCKNNGFEGLTGCVRERKKYQTNINLDTKKHPTIDGKPMLNLCSKKRCGKIENHQK